MIRSRVALVLVSTLVVSTLAAGGARAAADNDDFASARLISSLPYQDTVDTTGATLEAGEPDAFAACASAGASVWYRYDATEPARLHATMAGSGFDAFVGVFEGDTFPEFGLLGCGRSAYFDVAAGRTYYLQVGSVDIDSSGNTVPLSGLATLTVEFNAPIPPPCADCPAFRNHVVPEEFPFRAGETSIGVNPKTNAAMFLMLTHTMRVTWDENDEPTWKQVDALTTSRTTNDPILWTDRATGRTFVAQLVAYVGSIVAFTDDDGETWTTTQPGIAAPSWDHQTLGGGPYPAGVTNPVYPNAVYYCAQLGISQCARSDDGGLTWGVPALANLGSCGGLHGHVTVDEEGTVYVPNKGCGSTQGVLASTTAGTTFELRRVPGTKPAKSDPKIAFDAGGRMYFAASSEGKAVVATSMDKGKTWSTPVDIGAAHGIQAAEFPMMVAGDDGRAAVAFYGSRTWGNAESADYPDAWHLYVSFTYDGGQTWETTNVTPNDPVQRGCLWLSGGSNPCRNLLDFQGMTIDAEGRVLIGYADGCTSADCKGIYGRSIDSRDSLGVIARQVSGKRLLAAFDPA